MRRSRLGAGAKSLERGSTFRRPRSKTPPAGARRREKTSADWRAATRAARCAVCGNPAHQGHHVIEKQVLRREGLAHLLWDLRNLLPLCAHCHELHHNASRRVPWAALRLENVEFAQEVGLLYRLRRMYPNDERRAA